MSDLPRDPAPENASEPASASAPSPVSETISRESPAHDPVSTDESATPAVPSEASETSPPSDRWAHRRAEPRPLAFFWTTLLAIGTVVLLAGTTSSGILGQDVYRPAVRTLVTFGLTCACILWPLFRLSQPPEAVRGTRVAIRDLPVVFIPLVAILLPQRLWFLAGWSTSITIAMALTILAWLLIIAGVLAASLEKLRAGEGDQSRGRIRAMLTIVAIIAAAPAVSLLTPTREPNSDPSMFLLASPITCVNAIVTDRPWSGLGVRVEATQWLAIAGLGFGVLASWVRAAWVSRRLPAPSPPVVPIPPSA
ncbi:MAG: hypothetical protein IT434_10460 [Phycisphaerales bacterium]|jgi:hypothetical protein|nr:hypothetical protein [Phycisphaerales bacterium]